MTIAAGDAHEFPIYAGRYRVAFPVLDADGDLVTAMSTPDSERSIDEATFADCTNEATEIATSSGVYYLDLTAAEMTSKCTSVIVKSATAGMKTTVLTLYPKRMPILRSGTAQAGAASTITLDSGASAKNGAYAGCYVQCSNNSPSNVQGQTRKIISYVGSTKVATVEAAWGTNPSSATTFDILVPETVNLQAFMGAEFADWGIAGHPKVDVGGWLGTAPTTPGTAGVPNVDAVRVSTSATAADNLETAALAYSATRGLSGTALPAAAADAAGGLVISDLGGLDADAQRSDVAAILVDTGTTLDGRIPAALSSGNMKSDVLAISTDAVAADNAEAFFDGTGYAGTGNTIPTVTAVTGLTAANLDVAVSTRLIGSTTGSGLTAVPWNAAWDAEVESEVDDALGAGTGTSLTAIPWNAAWDAEVQSEAADALAAFFTTAAQLVTDVWAAATRVLTAGTNIVLAKGVGVTGFNDLSAAQVNTEADTALTDYDAPTNTEMVAAFTEIKGATWSSVTDTLEAIRDRGDAAWTTAVGFSTHTAADVWAVATRLLTAGTNIVLTKGVGLLGLNDLAGGDVRTAVGLASANLDTQLDAVPTAAENADAVLDDAVEGTRTVRQMLRGFAAVLLGKLSGAATVTNTIRDIDDSKDRVVASVDADGNRTAITLDLT